MQSRVHGDEFRVFEVRVKGRTSGTSGRCSAPEWERQECQELAMTDTTLGWTMPRVMTASRGSPSSSRSFVQSVITCAHAWAHP